MNATLDRPIAPQSSPWLPESSGAWLRLVPRVDGEVVRFEMFKQRILLQWLNTMPDLELHARIIQEANESARQARLTSFPFLVFPCLLEERIQAASDRERQRSRIYWHDLMPQ